MYFENRQVFGVLPELKIGYWTDEEGNIQVCENYAKSTQNSFILLT